MSDSDSKEEVNQLGKIIGDRAMAEARQEADRLVVQLLSVGGVLSGWGSHQREVWDVVQKRLASVQDIIRRRALERFLQEHEQYKADLDALANGIQEIQNG